MLARQKLARTEETLAMSRNRIAELERQLQVRSVRDALTGLPTLNAFGWRLDVELERSRRHGCELVAGVVDLDGFRDLNARHGGAVGDQVLQAVATVFAVQLRLTDFVSRVRGDQFVVVLPDVDTDSAVRMCERLHLILGSTHVGPVLALSASIGLAQYEKEMSADDLLGLASERMRVARVAGGGRTVAQGGFHGQDDPAGDPYTDVIAGLTEALIERDRYTGQHSESVVALAGQVGRGLGLDQKELHRLRAAALLHDIGKVAIPDDILNKSGPLSEGEWDVMREHPVIGERILRAVPGLSSVAQIVRHEHERFDGTGYPDGVEGHQIPIGARIILACDAYHAMTSDRPYRNALSHADAIRELAGNAGSQFDPSVTEILIGCLYGSRQLADG